MDEQYRDDIDGLMQERLTSIASAMELRLKSVK